MHFCAGSDEEKEYIRETIVYRFLRKVVAYYLVFIAERWLIILVFYSKINLIKI